MFAEILKEKNCPRGQLQDSPNRNWLWIATRGAIGGIFGSLIGHMAVILAHRWTGDADIWLKGPHGPPFFDLTFSNALFYAGLGILLCRGSWKDRSRCGALSFAAAFLVFALPMILGTHIFTWGEGPQAQETRAWVYLVLGSYAVATGAAAFILGKSVAPGGHIGLVPLQRKYSLLAAVRSSSGGLGAILGAFAAWLLQFGARSLFPAWGQKVEVIGGIWPPPSALYSGALWGGLIGLGIVASEKVRNKSWLNKRR